MVKTKGYMLPTCGALAVPSPYVLVNFFSLVNFGRSPSQSSRMLGRLTLPSILLITLVHNLLFALLYLVKRINTLSITNGVVCCAEDQVMFVMKGSLGY